MQMLYQTEMDNIKLLYAACMTSDVKLGSVPVASQPYNTALKNQEFLKQELKALLDSGVIKKSMSSYAAPIIVVN